MIKQGMALATACIVLASCSGNQNVAANKPMVFKRASIVAPIGNALMRTTGAIPAPKASRISRAVQPSQPIAAPVIIGKSGPLIKEAGTGPTPAERVATLPKVDGEAGLSAQQAAAFAAVEIGGGLSSVLRARRQLIDGTRHTLQIRLLDGSDHLVVIQQDPEGRMKLTSHKQTSA